MKGLPENVTVSFGVQTGDPDRLNTLYGLLLAGKENCVGEASEDPVQKTFDFEDKDKLKVVEPVPQVDPVHSEPKDDDTKKQSAFGRIWKTLEKMLSDEADSEDEKV